MERGNRPRIQRRDKGRTKLLWRDVWGQTQVGELGAMRLDQLQVRLGQLPQRATRDPGLLGMSTTRRVVGRWESAGFARCKVLLSGEPPWVWLTNKGLRELELPYREVQPSVVMLNHYYWVNHVNFWFSQNYPYDQWISERRLRKEVEQTRQAHKHIPDAEIQRYDEGGDQTTIAVEVELTVKERKRSLSIMQELAQNYDGVWYFTNAVTDAAVRRALSQFDEEVSEHFRIRSLTELP